MQQLLIGKYQIKSKYIGEWQTRGISINFVRNRFGISQQGQHLFKYFSLSQIQKLQKFQDILKITINSGRTYEIKGQNIDELLNTLKSYQIIHNVALQTSEVTLSVPKNIDYCKYLKSKENDEAKAMYSERRSLNEKKIIVHPRQKSYLKQQDWAINPDGGLILISQQKKKNQGKIIKFVLKKFITTGSFMGISFPVFAMKPQSILQTYCKSFSAAPLIFDNYSTDPVERLKKFTCFCFTISRLFSDIDKPFNPTIGQTFQAKIADGLFTAEQTSHHPPQSSIHFQGNGYIIYATLQLVAQIGVNSATGMMLGDVVIEFKTGQKIIGRLFAGQMSGFILGQNKFQPNSPCYAYDPKSKMICSYKCCEKDIFRGYIGTLQQYAQNSFQKILKSKQRFTNFEAHDKRQFKKISSQLQGCWSKLIKFDNQIYIDFEDPKWLPYQPTYEGLQLLDSDSRHRKDIKLRQLNKLDQSQQQKQRIESQQRLNRKLRSNNTKKNIKK